MTCEYIPPSKTRLWLSESFRLTGDELWAAKIHKSGHDELMPENFGLFMCGSFKPSPRCRCGQLADYLCDEPMGKGKTCDIPLCDVCKTAIGADLDLCPVHAQRQRLRPVQTELALDDQGAP